MADLFGGFAMNLLVGGKSLPSTVATTPKANLFYLLGLLAPQELVKTTAHEAIVAIHPARLHA